MKCVHWWKKKQTKKQERELVGGSCGNRETSDGMESAVLTLCCMLVLVTRTAAQAASDRLYFLLSDQCVSKSQCSNGLGKCDANSSQCICGVQISTVRADGCVSRSFTPNMNVEDHYDKISGFCWARTVEKDRCYWYFGARCYGSVHDPKCRCPEHHFFDGRICVKSFFSSGECKADGTTCSNGNGKCFGGVCACKKNFYAAVQGEKCVSSYFITGEKCPKGSDCWLGRDLQPGRCQGDNTTCRCPDSSFAVGRRCVRDFLEQLCSTGEPCGGGDGQCDSSGRCVCKDGYYVQGALCRALSFKPTVACSPNETCSEGNGKCQTDGSCLCTGEYFVHKDRCVISHYQDPLCNFGPTCLGGIGKCHPVSQEQRFCMCPGDAWLLNGFCVGPSFPYRYCKGRVGKSCNRGQGQCTSDTTCKCYGGKFMVMPRTTIWKCTNEANLSTLRFSIGSLALLVLPDLRLLALTVTATTILQMA
ncbi:hypothetical protein BaRGS_00033198 [Batillaria attramentaria]|uniref:EGF-like domain-containing protein n=1 Tax=Batillaria attramentaria TaxID=370345 RepID=A0ABD0JKS1_9CAEN